MDHPQLPEIYIVAKKSQTVINNTQLTSRDIIRKLIALSALVSTEKMMEMGEMDDANAATLLAVLVSQM